jgi:bis(5'-nucleosidyl)-tetraphosphatase
MKNHVDAIIVFIYNENKDKVLMLKRVNKFGFDWGFMCGKFEEKETAKECAKREIFEELGLKDLELKKFKVLKHEKDEQIFYHHYFYTIIKKNTKIDYQKEEIEETKWFKFDELPESRAPDDPLEPLKKF